MRSNSWQAVQDGEQRFDTLFSSDPDICDLWLRGNAGGLVSLPTESERLQFTLLAKQLLDQFQTHHYQYERGLIEAEMWDIWIAEFKDDVVRFPGFREVLEQRRKYLRPSFARFIDEHLPEGDE